MIFHWAANGFTSNATIPPGTKIVGLIRDNKRPWDVTFNRADLIYVKDHPGYLDMVIGVLRNADQG